MAATMAEIQGAEVQVFKSVEDAMSWLEAKEEARANEEASEPSGIPDSPTGS